MKKNVTVLVFLILALFVISSCKKDTIEVNKMKVSDMSFDTLIDDFDYMLGISPDGKEMVTIQEDELLLVDATSLDEIDAYTMDEEEQQNIVKLGQLCAKWSGDGRYICLTSATDSIPTALKTMQVPNLYVYDKKEKDLYEVVEVDPDASLEDFSVAFEANWLDDDTLIYNCLEDGKYRLKTVTFKGDDFDDGEKIYQYEREDKDIYSILPLSDNLILMAFSQLRPDMDSEIVLYNIKKDDEESIEEMDLGQVTLMHIRDASIDKRTVLVQNKTYSQDSGYTVISPIIITFKEGMSDYTTIEPDFDEEYGTILNMALTRDGQYLIVSTLEPQRVMHYLLYDIAKDDVKELFSIDSEDIGDLPEGNIRGMAIPQTMFTTNDGFLYVYTEEGYRRYQLEE